MSKIPSIFLRSEKFSRSLERENEILRAEYTAEIAELRAAISMALETNGGPISSAATIDGNEYVMVRMDAFQNLTAIDTAMKSP